MRLIRLVPILLLTMLVSACSSFHERETLEFGGDPAAWRAPPQSLEPIQSWTLQGKLGLRSEQESGSGTLWWQQNHRFYDIRLSGPLGRGATRIQGSPGCVILEMAGRTPYHAESAGELLEQQVGWRLPVEHLLWWVRGLPDPDRPSRLQLDASSRAARITQAGWTVEYSRYQQVGDVELPQRLQISGHDILLTLVVTDWQPEARP